ncbi:MAG TPA: ADOP family duplicated permease [Vicinamibacterales bacterium]|nr:ADOP family duplicated permease [Vicinamibacterales bacterium]
MLQDVHYSLRLLSRSPGFTLTAILTLALGIGANIAMFSVLYGVLLRPFPYRDASRLVLVRAEATFEGANRPVQETVSAPERAAWRRDFDALESVAFFATGVEALSGGNGLEVLDSATVSAEFFDTVGGPLAAGRPLGSADDVAPVAIVSSRLAARLFGGAEGAPGRSLTLGQRVYTVVGVVSPEFQLPSDEVDVWMPAGFAQSVNPRCCGYRVIGRLTSDGTPERAAAAVRPMFEDSAATSTAVNRVRTTVVPLGDEIAGTVRSALVVLFAAVLLVLLAACSNLVNLLLARNASRQQEFAVRRALGAPSRRLARQLFVEAALLVAAGAGLGALMARVALAGLSRVAADVLPRAGEIRIDTAALGFAAALAGVATILTGLLPAIRAARSGALPFDMAGRTATRSGTRRLQQTMCTVQVALAVVLLVGATLLGRSLSQLLRVDLGVSTDHVLTASLNLGFGGRPPDAETIARINRVVDAVTVLPGVRAAGAGTSLPPNVSRMRLTLRRSGDTVDYQASAVPVTPGYFPSLQMRLLQGRFFTSTDHAHHPQVMIMSERTARRFFGDGTVVGRTMRLPVVRDGKTASVDMTLVGVTSDVKYAGLAAPPDDVVYRPFAQQPWMAPFLVVRTSGDPAAFAPTLRRAIAAADPAAVTGAVTTLDQAVLDAVAQPRFRTVLLGSLALLAIAIAAVGLHGVVAYAVSQRAREFGIRMALGATSRDVLDIVLTEGLIMGAAGIAAGTAAALLLTRALSGLLYGITPTDPVSFGLAAAGLLALTLLATYVPARRAARIDPIRALRSE